MGRATSTKRENQHTEQIQRPQGTNGDSHETVVRERLQAARFLLESRLTHLQEIVEQDRFLTSHPSARGLDINDSRDFFLEKFHNIRASLKHMAEELNLPMTPPKNKEVLDLELLALMVVVERSRAPQIAPDDCEFDRHVREVLRDTIESVALDLLKLRARIR